MIMKKIISLVFVVSLTTPIIGQNVVANAMIEMDKRLTNYEILKVDTEYYATAEAHKLFYYDIDGNLRKTIELYKMGQFKSIFNRNKDSHSDGLSLDFYKNGTIKSYGISNDRTGFSYQYYESGRIKKYSQSRGTYYTGYSSSYCSEGELYSEIFYDSLDYVKRGFHCNGSLRFKGRIINNEGKEGKWEYWNKDSFLIKEQEWEKGKLIKEEEFESPPNSTPSSK
jgi:antitoxin component YwqK of YwqJK toxin-antitoxin module